MARTSRSERRFQSCASVARLYAPVRLVTPIEVIRAIRAGAIHHGKACGDLETAG